MSLVFVGTSFFMHVTPVLLASAHTPQRVLFQTWPYPALESDTIQFGNFKKLKRSHSNLRPDSEFRKAIVEKLKNDLDKKPVIVGLLEKELKKDNHSGRFHWFKYGRRLLQGIYNSYPQLFITHDVYVVINRKSNNRPERNGIHVYCIKDPFVRPAPAHFTIGDTPETSDFLRVRLEDMEALIDKSFNTSPITGEYSFAIIPIKRNKPRTISWRTRLRWITWKP